MRSASPGSEGPIRGGSTERTIPPAGAGEGSPPASGPTEVPAEAAPAPGRKECVACLEPVRAAARVCPSCGTKLALLEGADREPARLLLGCFLVALGSLLPWGVVPSRWLGEFARVAWLLLGLWGIWRIWVAILSRRISPAPLLLQVVPFFWGLRFVAAPLLLDSRGELPARLLESRSSAGREAGLPDAVAEIGFRLEAVGVGPILVLVGSGLTLIALAASVVSGARRAKARKEAAARVRRPPDAARPA